MISLLLKLWDCHINAYQASTSKNNLATDSVTAGLTTVNKKETEVQCQVGTCSKWGESKVLPMKSVDHQTRSLLSITVAETEQQGHPDNGILTYCPFNWLWVKHSFYLDKCATIARNRKIFYTWRETCCLGEIPRARVEHTLWVQNSVLILSSMITLFLMWTVFREDCWSPSLKSN